MKKIIATALALFCLNAHGAYVSGQQLLTHINNTQSDAWIGFANGYIAAIADVADETEIVCSPKEVTVGQMRLVTKRFMEQNPEKLHYSASSIVTFALMQAWPCKN